ncbi:MAG: dephospho-CoA kinase [Flavobacterium sp.]
MSLLVGITGGIGSGKSTIAKWLELKGYPVFYADMEAKKILFQAETIQHLVNKFGDGILENGQLDKTKLGTLVFNQPDKLQQLNKIIHPMVAIAFSNWVQRHSDRSILFKEAAILFETGGYKSLDYNILVTAPKKVRIQRVMQRDSLSKEDVLNRMKQQLPDSVKRKLADFTIYNVHLEKAYQKASSILKKLEKIQSEV